MKTTHKYWFALTATTLGLTGLSLASGLGDEKYTYDASGNVLEKQIGNQVTRYDYTGNQLNGSESDSGSKQYVYDSSGRITSDSEAGKPTRNMEHQYLDKVTKVQNGDKTTEFFYNAEGQLVATNSAGTSETFAWDGLAMVNRGDELYVNEAHAVGGVPAIIGNEVAVSNFIGTSILVGETSFESTAYGEGLGQGMFTGKPFIESLDGFLFKYRTYSADAGRWKSSDPSGYPESRNNLKYVLGDPAIGMDPLGLSTLVRTIAPVAVDDTYEDNIEITLVSGGRERDWNDITLKSTTYFLPTNGADASGPTVSVGCILEGKDEGTWAITGNKGPVGVTYTFGTGGTHVGTGTVSPDEAAQTGYIWTGRGGLARRKMSFVGMYQFQINDGNGNWVGTSDPEESGYSGTQAADFLSETVVGEFKKYEM